MLESNKSEEELWGELESSPASNNNYIKKKPDKCSICGYKTKRLKSRPVGKVTFYLCKFCTSNIK